MIGRKSALVGVVLCLILACVSCTRSVAQQSASVESRSSHQAPSGETVAELTEAAIGIQDRTNALRRDAGLDALVTDRALQDTARDFADFMAHSGTYGHSADGSNPVGRAHRHGYDHCILSENIAYQFNPAEFTIEQVIENTVGGWQRSSGHRNNMLDPDVTQTGVALARGAHNGYVYAVQLFARPRSAQRIVQISNASDAPASYSLGDKPYRLRPGEIRTHRTCRPSVLILPTQDQPEGMRVLPDDGDRFEIR